MISFTKCCFFHLTCQGPMTHICISRPLLIQMMACRLFACQAIIWTNAGLLSIGHLETSTYEISVEMKTFSLKKINFKILSAKWQPSCHSLNVLIIFCLSHQHISVASCLSLLVSIECYCHEKTNLCYVLRKAKPFEAVRCIYASIS